jgi:hypothetical protein
MRFNLAARRSIRSSLVVATSITVFGTRVRHAGRPASFGLTVNYRFQ